MRTAFLCLALVSSACTEEFASTSTKSTALDANPCTSVALTAPASGFGATVGSPTTLTATAVCPPGQVPEFEYWGKNVGDQNWTILTGYVPGSTTYTPIAADAGDWCFSAVVRAVGSTDSFQARSGSVCGTVTSGLPAPVIQQVTVSLPIFAPVHDSATPNQSASTTGSFGPQGFIVQLSGIPIGATVTRIAARVQDSVMTTCGLGIVEQSDNAPGTIIAAVTSTSSSKRSGLPQTIAVMVPFSVASFHQYWIGVFPDDSSNDPCIIFSIEATYSPST